MKSSLELVQNTYTNVAERYLYGTNITNKKFLRKFLSYLPDKGKILDAGCGPGQEARFFSDSGYYVLGIDKNKKMLSVAKKYVKTASFSEIDMLKMRFSNEFDAVFSAYTISEIQKREFKPLIERFHRALKSNGILCIVTEWGKGIHFIKSDKVVFNNPMIYILYTKTELLNYLKDRFKILHSSVAIDAEKEKVIYIIGRKK